MQDVVGVIGHDAPFAREHNLRTWDANVLEVAVGETRGNLRQLQVLLAQLELLEQGGTPLKGRSETYQGAVIRKVATEFLYRVA